MERNPDFLKKKYGNLHTSDEVDSAVHRYEFREGKKVSNKPNERIQVYLDRFKEITEREDVDERNRGISALKEVLYKQYIPIESGEDIPEAHLELQRRIAREQGHGDVEIDESKLDEYTEIIRADQKQSLDQWVDYMASPDAMYPDWLKYWAMRSVLSLSDYDKEKKAFGNRSKDTTKPFPDLNHEALAYVLDVIQKRATGSTVENPVQERQNEFAAEDKKVISDKDFQQMLSAENFSKLYAFAIEHVTADHSELYKITDGEWVVYPMGSPGHDLARSLQGHGTGWCTAGEATANTQLQQGDFHVYYSKNPHGDATIPRLAIRMEGEKIAEVRGVAHKQEIDPYISPVLEEKLGDFGDEAETYRTKTEHMKRLTEIDERLKKQEELTVEDLRFLYEMDGKIQGFGYVKDPRVTELLKERDKHKDFGSIFNVSPDKIALNQEEALKGDMLYYHGPELYLNDRVDSEGLSLPKHVNNNVHLNGISTGEGVTLPETVDKTLQLNGLTTTEGLKLPTHVGETLMLENITSASGLVLPQYVGSLYMSRIVSCKDVVLPEYVEKDIDLGGVLYAKGMVLPKHIGRRLSLTHLQSTEGLVLPENLKCLDLRSIKVVDNLVLPQRMNLDLYLNNLESAKGLTLPEYIGGNLILSHLNTTEGLVLPKYVGRELSLDSLEYIDGWLALPEFIGKRLNLNNLKSAKGLILPEDIKGMIFLSSLPEKDFFELKQKYPNLNIVR